MVMKEKFNIVQNKERHVTLIYIYIYIYIMSI